VCSWKLVSHFRFDSFPLIPIHCCYCYVPSLYGNQTAFPFRIINLACVLCRLFFLSTGRAEEERRAETAAKGRPNYVLWRTRVGEKVSCHFPSIFRSRSVFAQLCLSLEIFLCAAGVSVCLVFVWLIMVDVSRLQLDGRFIYALTIFASYCFAFLLYTDPTLLYSLTLTPSLSLYLSLLPHSPVNRGISIHRPPPNSISNRTAAQQQRGLMESRQSWL